MVADLKIDYGANCGFFEAKMDIVAKNKKHSSVFELKETIEAVWTYNHLFESMSSRKPLRVTKSIVTSFQIAARTVVTRRERTKTRSDSHVSRTCLKESMTTA